jgi:sigma-B regulation protein RsbU (phosphoserine phosphatase)
VVYVFSTPRAGMITDPYPSRATEAELNMALAAELQAALLPPRRTLRCANQDVAALNRTCGSVGGDFLDLIQLNDEQIALVMGDVVGHGVTASLLMALIMDFLRSAPARCARPVQMISSLNRMLLDLGDRSGAVMPCSVFYAVIDIPSGVGFFVNAGQPIPFLCDRRSCLALHLGEGNTPLGVEDFEPAECCHTFLPGERLVLYSDGIVDATDPRGLRFDRSKLHHALIASGDTDATCCARAVFDAVDEFRDGAPQSDDESILVIDRS